MEDMPQHLGTWWSAVASAVASGILVAAILGGARLAWHRTRVPSALSRRVRRRSYVGAVRAESGRPEVRRLDVYAPRLLPARDSKVIARIQAGWEQINNRGRVRVLTLDLEECLHAGAELLDRGIEVRVLPSARALGSESLTFHLFETALPEDSMAIINHHHGDADRPVRFKGTAPTEVFRERFRNEWDHARPLESVIAERILPRSAGCQGRSSFQRSIDRAETTGLHLGARSTQQLLPHFAFQDSCAVVFVLGLPGSGKSYIRTRLGRQLGAMRIDHASLSDYPYAYLDLVRAVLKLSPTGQNGFRVHDGGAFAVMNEKSLLPALQELHAAVRDSVQEHQVTFVEFARADLPAALQVFDDIRSRSHIIYASAPAAVRQARLAHRAVPPELRLDGQMITLNLSDNHLLPATAERTLYASDSLDRLKTSANWRDRIFEIDNEYDGAAHVDMRLAEFIETIMSPYRAGSNPPAHALPVPASP